MAGVSNLTDAQHSWTSPLAFLSLNGFLGVRLTASSISSRIQLQGPATSNALSVVLTNVDPTNEAYIAFGGPTVVAGVSHFPVLPGTQVTCSLPGDMSDLWVAACTATGTASVLIHTGYGV